MKVHVVRDAAVQPGACAWLELGCDEMVAAVSAAGVSEEGARCLQSCWGWFIEQGLWRWQDDTGTGEPVRATYHHGEPPSGDVVEIAALGGDVEVWLSPEHFTAASVTGLERAVRDCIAAGWTAHDPARATARGAA